MTGQRLEDALWDNFGYHAFVAFTDTFAAPFAVSTMSRVMDDENSIWNQPVENAGMGLGFIAGVSAGLVANFGAGCYFILEEARKENYVGAFLALSVPVITNISSWVYESVRTVNECGKKKNGH